MSLNRENVTWQSSNGKWNIAFYAFHYVNQDDEDFDPEWDVEYTDDFNWVSTGHATKGAADSAWTGANPGGGTQVEYSAATAKTCDAYDAKVGAYRIAKSKAAADLAAHASKWPTPRRY